MKNANASSFLFSSHISAYINKVLSKQSLIKTLKQTLKKI